MAQVLSRKVQAIKIYNRISARNTVPNELRTKVLKELQAKVGMTPGAASTYFANIKNGTWSVNITAVKVAKVVKAVKAKPALTVVPKTKAVKAAVASVE